MNSNTKPHLSVVESSADPKLIKQLESALAAARRGDITGISGIAIYSDGAVRYVTTGSAHAVPHVTLALLEKLLAKIRATIIR